MGHSPWGRDESDTTERLTLSPSLVKSQGVSICGGKWTLLPSQAKTTHSTHHCTFHSDLFSSDTHSYRHLCPLNTCVHTRVQKHTPAGTDFSSYLKPHIYPATHHIHSITHTQEILIHTCFLNPKLFSLTSSVLSISWLLMLQFQTATRLPHPASAIGAGCPVHPRLPHPASAIGAGCPVHPSLLLFPTRVLKFSQLLPLLSLLSHSQCGF